MNRNIQSNESSLLLQIPKSVLSFSDMSGNSFLMPVAVESAAVPETVPENSNPENLDVDEPRVCQLQQPLLMRRETSPIPTPTTTSTPISTPNASVPYSESSIQTNNEPFPRENSHSGPPVLPAGLGTRLSNQPPDRLRSSLFIHTGPMPGTVQNHPSAMLSQNNHSASSRSKPVDKENINPQRRNAYPRSESSNPFSRNNASNASGLLQVYSGPSENNSERRSVTSSAERYSQPPVITPSNIPAYPNTSRRSSLQTPESSFPNMQLDPGTLPLATAYSYIYEPLKPYWLFKNIVEKKEVWYGFNKKDSEALETAFQQEPQAAVVHVDGGRYDAILSERIKRPVYYEGPSLQIQRCTWYFLHETSRYVPFPEETSTLIEEYYRDCMSSRQWQKVLDLPSLGSIFFESPEVILYYKKELEPWSPLPPMPEPKGSPKTIKRGLPESIEIMISEDAPIDHLVFVVQGIGSVCDLRFRTVSECVDGVRDLSYKLLASHFRAELESKQVGRVEFLPLAWHAKLHTSDKGFDRAIQNITLPSIPKLRHFTNDTLLDILLYSSPFYCQTIIDTVTSDLNKLYELFMKRNPGFTGKVFVAGHSLGSLILFDLLSHQKLDNRHNMSNDEMNAHEYDSIGSLLEACELECFKEAFEELKIDMYSVALLSNENLKEMGMSAKQRKKLLSALYSSNTVKLLYGDEEEFLFSSMSDEEEKRDQTISNSESIVFPHKTSPCMSSIRYPRLHFEPAALFALGSPISMFMTVRGYDQISDDFRFPTCPGFFHIFHPYDPVAYRIEPLIDPCFSAKPVLIPHHKGRKRMHLEIRENLAKVGFEIKQKVLETLKSTWNSLSGFARSHTFSSAAVEAEVDKLVSEQISEVEYEQPAPSEISGEELQIGSLNGGRRIDYVLQEKPIEALNDYIFALTSHSTYWNSEDTVLMILREIYATQGILVSSQSILDQREIIPSGLSSYEGYTPMSPGTSSSYLHEVGRQQSFSSFYSQGATPTMPGPMEALSIITTPVFSSSVPGHSQRPLSPITYPPQVSSNVPQPPTSQQVGPPSSQQVGPPPLKGFVKRSPFTLTR